MYSSIPSPKFLSLPKIALWQDVLDWAKFHYRDRTFSQDELIPTRQGLLYLVEKGSVRLVGSPAQKDFNYPLNSMVAATEEVFLGLVGTGQPFEIIAQFTLTIQAYAHLEATTVIWIYWHELEEKWPHLQLNILEFFRYQHQRKLLLLSILGHKRTLDRLLGFLSLMMEEHGIRDEQGYYLPYPLTHAQIGSAIGATRVTVTRLLGRLRQEGIISIKEEHFICLNQKNIES